MNAILNVYERQLTDFCVRVASCVSVCAEGVELAANAHNNEI
jgi:hypothetical protein